MQALVAGGGRSGIQIATENKPSALIRNDFAVEYGAAQGTKYYINALMPNLLNYHNNKLYFLSI